MTLVKATNSNKATKAKDVGDMVNEINGFSLAKLRRVEYKAKVNLESELMKEIKLHKKFNTTVVVEKEKQKDGLLVAMEMVAIQLEQMV